MQVTEKDIKIDSTWFSPERHVERSPGIHLSDVINFIENKGELSERDFDQAGIQAYMAGGFLWERVVFRLIESDPTQLWEWLFSRAMVEVDNPKVIRPGEQCVDGIYMTPDGLNFSEDPNVLEEYKYTTKSSNNSITSPKFSRWVDYQIPAYLKALGLTKCRLRIYFARGNYTDGVPLWREYLLVYTQQEIDETWEMILNNANALRMKLGLAPV